MCKISNFLNPFENKVRFTKQIIIGVVLMPQLRREIEIPRSDCAKLQG